MKVHAGAECGCGTDVLVGEQCVPVRSGVVVVYGDGSAAAGGPRLWARMCCMRPRLVFFSF
jgi:hypothetical protein